MKYIVLALFVPLVLAGCIKTTTNVDTTANTNEVVKNDDTMVNTENDNMDKETLVYNLAEFSKHDNADDCWLLIDGKIYDVTDFIASGNHGGGDAILEGCGIDSTELYKTRPMGSGTDHSAKAYGFLKNFFLADLEE